MNVCVQSPMTTVSCDADSDSSHVTGSCSPSDSVNDVMPHPPPRQRRARLSRSLFPPGSPDVVPASWTPVDAHQSTAVVVPSPLAGWCPPALVVDHAASATSVLSPELLGTSYAYCRLAAAAAASIAGSIYWGRRRCDDKSAAGVDLMLPWSSAGFTLPTLTFNQSPASADNPVSGGVSTSVLNRSPSCVDVTMTDDVADIKVDSSSGSTSPVDVDDENLPLDLSPAAKRIRVNSPLISVVAADACSV